MATTDKGQLNLQCERACEALPEGWQIVIELERGAGYARLFEPDGVELEINNPYDSLAEQVAHAISIALSASPEPPK